MERQIYIYGHGDKSKEGIPDAEYMAQYIRDDVFKLFKARFHHTQGKNADVIVLSQDGILYGHFDIEEKVPVSMEDRKAYSKVKAVYIVRRSALYENPVPLSRIGNPKIQFGYRITEDQFNTIQNSAGNIEHFTAPSPQP